MKEDLATLIEFRLMDPLALGWVARGSLFAVLALHGSRSSSPTSPSSSLVVFMLGCFYSTL